MLPPVTAMSDAVKFVLTSDKIKERAILLSVEASPSLMVVEKKYLLMGLTYQK